MIVATDFEEAVGDYFLTRLYQHSQGQIAGEALSFEALHKK